MRCPKCGGEDTRVIDTRIDRKGLSIRRRRLCQSCEYRFSTLEEVVREGLTVLKRDGRREPFDRQKILDGLRRATEKRPIDWEQVEMLATDVMDELTREFDAAVPAQAIGERVMQKLRGIDKIAWVRFACVYRDFAELSDLESEISALRDSS